MTLIIIAQSTIKSKLGVLLLLLLPVWGSEEETLNVLLEQEAAGRGCREWRSPRRRKARGTRLPALAFSPHEAV